MIELKIVCEDEKYLPRYANATDACMDLRVKVNSAKTVIPAGCTQVFGTGIKVAIPEEHVMLMYPRSSTGIKMNCMLSNTTGVIDSGYRDEIKLSITNFGKQPVVLSDGQRVAQFLIIPRPVIELIHVKDDEDFKNGDRGGGIGSSGTN